jgi:hypothetical protein
MKLKNILIYISLILSLTTPCKVVVVRNAYLTPVRDEVIPLFLRPCLDQEFNFEYELNEAEGEEKDLIRFLKLRLNNFQFNFLQNRPGKIHDLIQIPLDSIDGVTEYFPPGYYTPFVCHYELALKYSLNGVNVFQHASFKETKLREEVFNFALMAFTRINLVIFLDKFINGQRGEASKLLTDDYLYPSSITGDLKTIFEDKKSNDLIVITKTLDAIRSINSSFMETLKYDNKDIENLEVDASNPISLITYMKPIVKKPEYKPRPLQASAQMHKGRRGAGKRFK